MGRDKSSKKSHSRSVATDWGEWEYDNDRRCYVNSRINSRGVRVYDYSEVCDPPVAPTEDLAGRIDQINISSGEPEPEGGDDVAQGEAMLPALSGNETTSSQLSPIPYSITSGSVSNYQGRGVTYMTGGQPGSAMSNSLGGMSPVVGIGRARMSWNSGQASSSWNSGQASSSWNSGQQYSAGLSGALPGISPPNGVFGNQAQNGTANKLPPTQEKFQYHDSSEFKVGYVIKVVWNEPKGNGNGRNRRKQSNLTYVYDTKHGELGYTSIRRFAIYKSHVGHSLCLPILTYGGQGTLKHGVRPWHHAIIYTTLAAEGDTEPPVGLAGEGPLPNPPIRVEAYTSEHHFDLASRINYAKVYTVEHNIKVSFVGKIHNDSIAEFHAAIDRVSSDDNIHPSNVGFVH
ncbi:hypothetical protein V492_04736 [Pseudogymnoascus sp. VKM F-4246]|nr:hypothetical protein V492_04736 [Pseudogymnoascus sp. VKM F-4246]